MQEFILIPLLSALFPHLFKLFMVMTLSIIDTLIA
jgi:hypothetical protein